MGEGLVVIRATNAGGLPLVAPDSTPAKPPLGDPTFSILMAARNAEATVAAALRSALAQEHAPLDVIVCDDGSTDGTAEAVAAMGPDVPVIRQAHGGAGAARNACLAAARGTYVLVLDADDILDPRCLGAYAQALRARPDLDVVTCDAFLEQDGLIFGRYYDRIASFPVADQRRAALHQHFIFGTAAIRRSVIEEAGGWDVTLPGGDDTDLYLRLILDGATVGLVWEPLARYRFQPGSLSDDRARSLRRMVTIVERAATHPSLSPAEREAVQAELTAKERLARLAELEAALRSGRGDVRARALAVAGDGLPVGTRARALGAAVLPRTSGRLLRLRDRRRGINPLRTRTRGL